MLNSVDLMLCRCDYEVRPSGQQVLRALVVQKAVEVGEPEGGISAALRLAEDQDIGEGFVEAVALYRAEARGMSSK